MGLTGSRPALALSRQVAVALGYDAARDRAPRILASGRGKTAEEIRRIARRHGVMVREDGDLAELLGRVPPFEEIPPRLYPVVAELLVFVYRMSRLASAPKS